MMLEDEVDKYPPSFVPYYERAYWFFRNRQTVSTQTGKPEVEEREQQGDDGKYMLRDRVLRPRRELQREVDGPSLIVQEMSEPETPPPTLPYTLHTLLVRGALVPAANAAKSLFTRIDNAQGWMLPSVQTKKKDEGKRKVQYTQFNIEDLRMANIISPIVESQFSIVMTASEMGAGEVARAGAGEARSDLPCDCRDLNEYSSNTDAQTNVAVSTTRLKKRPIKKKKKTKRKKVSLWKRYFNCHKSKSNMNVDSNCRCKKGQKLCDVFKCQKKNPFKCQKINPNHDLEFLKCIEEETNYQEASLYRRVYIRGTNKSVAGYYRRDDPGTGAGAGDDGKMQQPVPCKGRGRKEKGPCVACNIMKRPKMAVKEEAPKTTLKEEDLLHSVPCVCKATDKNKKTTKTKPCSWNSAAKDSKLCSACYRPLGACKCPKQGTGPKSVSPGGPKGTGQGDTRSTGLPEPVPPGIGSSPEGSGPNTNLGHSVGADSVGSNTGGSSPEITGPGSVGKSLEGSSPISSGTGLPEPVPTGIGPGNSPGSSGPNTNLEHSVGTDSGGSNTGGSSPEITGAGSVGKSLEGSSPISSGLGDNDPNIIGPRSTVGTDSVGGSPGGSGTEITGLGSTVGTDLGGSSPASYASEITDSGGTGATRMIGSSPGGSDSKITGPGDKGSTVLGVTSSESTGRTDTNIRVVYTKSNKQKSSRIWNVGQIRSGAWNNDKNRIGPRGPRPGVLCPKALSKEGIGLRGIGQGISNGCYSGSRRISSRGTAPESTGQDRSSVRGSRGIDPERICQEKSGARDISLGGLDPKNRILGDSGARDKNLRGICASGGQKGAETLSLGLEGVETKRIGVKSSWGVYSERDNPRRARPKAADKWDKGSGRTESKETDILFNKSTRAKRQDIGYKKVGLRLNKKKAGETVVRKIKSIGVGAWSSDLGETEVRITGPEGREVGSTGGSEESVVVSRNKGSEKTGPVETGVKGIGLKGIGSVATVAQGKDLRKTGPENSYLSDIGHWTRNALGPGVGTLDHWGKECNERDIKYINDAKNMCDGNFDNVHNKRQNESIQTTLTNIHKIVCCRDRYSQDVNNLVKTGSKSLWKEDSPVIYSIDAAMSTKHKQQANSNEPQDTEEFFSSLEDYKNIINKVSVNTYTSLSEIIELKSEERYARVGGASCDVRPGRHHLQNVITVRTHPFPYLNPHTHAQSTTHLTIS